MGGPREYAGGKKIKGRERLRLVDTQGTLVKNKVHPADIHDRSGAELVLEGLQHLFPAIERMWADTAYRGRKDWLRRALGWRLSIPQYWWTGSIWMRVGSEPPTRPSGFLLRDNLSGRAPALIGTRQTWAPVIYAIQSAGVKSALPPGLAHGSPRPSRASRPSSIAVSAAVRSGSRSWECCQSWTRHCFYLLSKKEIVPDHSGATSTQ